MHSTRTGKQPGAAAILLATVCFSNAVQAELQEVLVTAQKRSESIRDVPIAMQALTADELKILNVDSAEDILAVLPNLSINGSNEINRGFTIRGVGTNNFHGNVNGAVAIYLDEVSQSTPYSGVLGVYDVERVEVLRGPQNALFGRNSTGGAISYFSHLPTPGEGVNGYARVTLGEDEQRDLEGALGFDLGSRAALRLALQSVQRDGLFTDISEGAAGRELGERDRQSYRLQLLWQPAEETELLLNVHHADNDGSTVGNAAVGLRDPDDPTRACDPAEILRGLDFETRVNCVDINGDNPSDNDWHTVSNNSTTQQDVEITGGFIRLNQSFAHFTLTSITAWEDTKVMLSDDTGATLKFQFQPHQDSEVEQFSQEIRLTGGGTQLHWIGGLYYFDEDLEQGTHIRRDNGGQNAPGGEIVASNFLDQNDEDLSIYGQFEYDISEQTTLTLGLRYTDNEKEAASLFGVGLLPVAQYPPTETFVSSTLVRELIADAPETCPPGAPGTARDGRPFGGMPPCTLPLLQPMIEEQEWTGKLGLDHKPTENIMVYGHYSRGFKSGGFDTRALAALSGDANQPVEKETLDAFEAGLKSELAAGRLQVDLAAFYYQWDDLQTFAVVAGIPGFFNIPESELYGLEAEIRWAPSESWYIQGSLGLLDTEITDAGEIIGVDEGHELTNAPEITFNGLIAREWALSSGRLTLQTDFRYVDEQLDSLQYATDDFATKDDNFFVNVRGIYVFGKQAQYQLAVWGENLTDETFCNDLGPLDDPFAPAPDDLITTNICSPNDGEARYGITATVNF